MIADPWFYAAAIPAMIILGLSKGGFGAIGMLTVPILALVISPVQAAAIVLPILVLSDIVAVVSYRGIYDANDAEDHAARRAWSASASAGGPPPG